MTLLLDENGLQIQTYQEIFDELVAEYQSIYGVDINVDPNSPDGQRIGIEVKARLDLQTLALDIYNQMDPDKATGEFLNKLIKLAGISRSAPTRSQVDVEITADRNVTIPVGYAVQDDLGQLWVTDSPVALVPGVNATTLFAENFGDVAADADTVTTPATIILGVVSVTNPLAATAGRDEETDIELRVRRAASVTSPITSSTAGLFTALANLEGVTDVAIYENDTDTLDAVLNLAAHSIWCVVEGGDIPDIIEQIARNKTGGTGIKGSVTGTYTETLDLPAGGTFDLVHELAFDRPTVIPLYVNLTVEGIGAAVVDTVGIQNALAVIDWRIAENAIASELYATVYSVADNFTATLLEISDDDITYTDGLLSPAADEKFSIAVADVTITVI